MSGRSAWGLVAGSYFSFLLFPFFALAVVLKGLAWLLPAALIVVIAPILDSLVAEDLTNRRAPLTSFQRSLLDVAPALFVLGNSVVILVAAHLFAQLKFGEQFFMSLAVGMIGSIGITAAHELIHKNNRISKVFGRIGLANACYLHFEINHIQGHHVRVGTPEDESTALLGETLYHFIARTVPGCIKCSWQMEKNRLIRRAEPVFGRHNLMLRFALIQVAWLIGVWYVGRGSGLVFFVLQAAVAVFMLESVSYIEHYGLTRRKQPDGKYDCMSPTNSWDFYGRFTSYLVFQLQRHADHHSFPTRPFSDLQTNSMSPKLPIGYPTLIGIAMLPPLWRWIMDQRVYETNGKHTEIPRKPNVS